MTKLVETNQLQQNTRGRGFIIVKKFSSHTVNQNGSWGEHKSSLELPQPESEIQDLTNYMSLHQMLLTLELICSKQILIRHLISSLKVTVLIINSFLGSTNYEIPSNSKKEISFIVTNYVSGRYVSKHFHAMLSVIPQKHTQAQTIVTRQHAHRQWL